MKSILYCTLWQTPDLAVEQWYTCMSQVYCGRSFRSIWQANYSVWQSMAMCQFGILWHPLMLTTNYLTFSRIVLFADDTKIFQHLCQQPAISFKLILIFHTIGGRQTCYHSLSLSAISYVFSTVNWELFKPWVQDYSRFDYYIEGNINLHWIGSSCNTHWYFTSFCWLIVVVKIC